MKHLFQDQQNKAIEDNYSSLPLYRLLNFVCAPIYADAKGFALRSGELFYNCLYSIDTLKGKSYPELKEHCTLLWSGIVTYLKDKSLTIDDPDVFNCAALISYSVSRCLLVSGISTYAYPSEIISNYLTELNPKTADTLRKRFNKALLTIPEISVSEWLKDYLTSDSFLSDEIERILDDTAEPDIFSEPEYNPANEIVPYDMILAQDYLANIRSRFNESVLPNLIRSLDRWWSNIPIEKQMDALCNKEAENWNEFRSSEFATHYPISLTPGFYENTVAVLEGYQVNDEIMNEHACCAMADLEDGIGVLNEEKLEKYVFQFQNILKEVDVFDFFRYQYVLDFIHKHHSSQVTSPATAHDDKLSVAIREISISKDSDGKPLMKFKADWIAVFTVLIQMNKVLENQYREGALIISTALKGVDNVSIPTEDDLSKKSCVINGILEKKLTNDLKQSKLDHYLAIIREFNKLLK